VKLNNTKLCSVFLFLGLLCILSIPSLVSADVIGDTYKPEVVQSVLKEDGVFNVGLQTCGMSYTVPIFTPPATNGLAPNLRLTYSSQGGSPLDLLGMGWDVTGSYIQRDVENTPDDLGDDTFDLVLNGDKHDLVYNPSTGRYHTQIESFVRIERLSGAPNSMGEYWFVTEKDGTKHRFGFNTDSENLANGRDYVWRWSLDETSDTHDNKIFYSYIEDGGLVTPDEIVYNNDGKRKIIFLFESKQPRVIYDQGSRIWLDKRLYEIKVYYDSSLVRRYHLDYTDSMAGQSILSSLTEFDSDGLSKPPYEFTYNSENNNWNPDSVWEPQVYFNTQTYYGDSFGTGARLADVNGDGLVDILLGESSHGGGETRTTHLNNKNGWNADESLKPPINFIYLDYNGKIWDQGVQLTDVNNDGLLDIIQGLSTYQGTTKNIYLNTGSAWLLDPPGWELPVTFTLHTINGDVYDNGVRIADVNGDKRPDILVGLKTDLGETKTAYINTGSNWIEDPSWAPELFFINRLANGDQLDYGVRLVDVNGDGLVDLVKSFYESGWGYTKKVFLNTGSGWQEEPSFNPPIEFTRYESLGGTCYNTYLQKDMGVRMADVNGDGRIDFTKSIYYSGSGVSSQVWLNTGDNWMLEPGFDIPVGYIKYKNTGYPCYADIAQDEGVRIVDVNGDGLSDFLNHLRSSRERARTPGLD